MLRRLGLIWFLLLASLARAQVDTGNVLVELRITSAQAGRVLIDRGSVDGLAEGDRVRFLPRGGLPFEGRVLQVGERNARVELDDRSLAPEPGTRGETRIPAERLQQAPAQEPRPKPAEETPEPEAPERSERWRNRDEEYRKGQPLLTRVRPLRPDERPASMTGRVYLIADAIQSSEDDHTSQFYRTGTSLLYDNVLGRGETIFFDGELNWRDFDVPDNDDQRKSRLRVDRLAVSFGGNRFDPARVQFGRFLQSGMPEFGVIDGAEWTMRTDSGSRFGASLGFLPEPNAEYETGIDFQGAAFYRWSYDESEQFTAAAGYQKSLHHGNADRDLFVVDVRLLPSDTWNLVTTAWIDLYTPGDEFKDPGLEPTQVLARLGRRWDDGRSLDFLYLHSQFPELDRNDYQQVLGTQLQNDHRDRLAVEGRAQLASHLRGNLRLGGWADEDDDGFDALLGTELRDALVDGLLVDLRAFLSNGRYSSEVGGRALLGLADTYGTWTLEYELSNQHIVGFTSANDDLPQHRVRFGRLHSTDSGWSLSAHVEGTFWDQESALALGLYLQRSF